MIGISRQKRIHWQKNRNLISHHPIVVIKILKKKLHSSSINISNYTIHFTVGFSSFVDAASSRQIAVVTLMLTVRDLQNLMLELKNIFVSQKQ